MIIIKQSKKNQNATSSVVVLRKQSDTGAEVGGLLVITCKKPSPLSWEDLGVPELLKIGMDPSNVFAVGHSSLTNEVGYRKTQCQIQQVETIYTSA